MGRLFTLAFFAFSLAGIAQDGRRAEPRALRVLASEAFAPCLEPALAAFARHAGVATALEVNDPGAAGVADVVVGDDLELTTLLEGGTADLATAVDLGRIPWVLVRQKRSSSGGTPADASAAPVVVFGGPVGREARRFAAKVLRPHRIKVSRDRRELGNAPLALLPRSLAADGEERPPDVRPLIMVAAVLRDSANASTARAFLEFMTSPQGREVLASCVEPRSEAPAQGGAEPLSSAAPQYAVSVIDWWLPRCTLERNGYNDPREVLGPPDAISLGTKDQFEGFMSLGQGGFVTLDMGVRVADGPGADVRVYQMVSAEPVTLYAATEPRGPFVLVGLQVSCGERRPGGGQLHHCDFDLHDAGLVEARYIKIEDGEIFPCLKAATISEGPDIDAVQVLNSK